MAQGRRLQECWRRDSCEELCDDVVEVLLCAQPFRSSTSTMAAISHMSETVASSRDMLSRLGRLLICLSVSTPVPAFVPRQSDPGSFSWPTHHEGCQHPYRPAQWTDLATFGLAHSPWECLFQPYT